MRKLTLAAMRSLARLSGGACLATTYNHAHQKLRWRCRKGHEWEAAANCVRSGGWCPYCAWTRLWAPGQTETEARLEACRALARERGGDCVAERYVNRNTKLRWRCAEGHEWEASPNNLMNKRDMWCPFCSGRRLWAPGLTEAQARLAECIALAGARDGRCLSGAYVNGATPLRWRCADGHEWEARPGNIKSGRWCPTCARRKGGFAARREGEPAA